ncbi:hypothetical protein [Clostridium botulinum]|uniref:hypothetical protein n=1 Tax=Clostridium botulinum TaxID=1491 RepID=UPI001C9BB875|nr:hypothetical protein [Clostridium botulinum]MBY6860777.1 hypothetical protein [Clostridium botulinum]MBY7043834.1 hypothetical protein [Clostridium botulinum]
MIMTKEECGSSSSNHTELYLKLMEVNGIDKLTHVDVDNIIDLIKKALINN